jgi:hypothetical protein
MDLLVPESNIAVSGASVPDFMRPLPSYLIIAEYPLLELSFSSFRLCFLFYELFKIMEICLNHPSDKLVCWIAAETSGGEIQDNSAERQTIEDQ